ARQAFGLAKRLGAASAPYQSFSRFELHVRDLTRAQSGLKYPKFRVASCLSRSGQSSENTPDYDFRPVVSTPQPREAKWISVSTRACKSWPVKKTPNSSSAKSAAKSSRPVNSKTWRSKTMPQLGNPER